MCRIDESGATCGSQVSGQIAQVVPGGGAFYLGGDAVEDNGGVALGFGQSVTNVAGTIRCDSSSRGITCVD